MGLDAGSCELLSFLYGTEPPVDRRLTNDRTDGEDWRHEQLNFIYIANKVFGLRPTSTTISLCPPNVLRSREPLLATKSGVDPSSDDNLYLHTVVFA